MVTKVDEEFTTEDLIAELQAYHNEERKPGGVTVEEWAEASDINKDQARQQLNRMLDKGLLTKQKARVNGERVFVFYKVTAAEEQTSP